jgi:lipopolysaccharide/colanic/teichoic acid biosynthesis glycosyltransferase
MDIVGSLAALILLSPLFVLLSAVIKLTSKGPVLFKQIRIGHHGVRFTFLKFRSMYFMSDPHVHQEFVAGFISGRPNAARAGRNEKTVFKLTQDARVTPLGKFLRRTSLDELPQFLNVLKGEMSLVGPRPPIPYEIESYDMWHRRRMLEAKPGITGLWQVSGRSRTTFDDMVRLDLKYAKAWSLWLDIKILARTPRAIFSGEGAY